MRGQAEERQNARVAEAREGGDAVAVDGEREQTADPSNLGVRVAELVREGR